MLSNDVQKRKRAMKIASAIGNIEGVPVSEKTKQLYLKWVKGEINEEQVISELYQKHRKAAYGMIQKIFEEMHKLNIIHVQTDILCIDSTSIKVHPDVAYARKSNVEPSIAFVLFKSLIAN